MRHKLQYPTSLTQLKATKTNGGLLCEGLKDKPPKDPFADGFQLEGYFNESMIDAIEEENKSDSTKGVKLAKKFTESLLSKPLLLTEPTYGRYMYPDVTEEENRCIIIQASLDSYTLNMSKVVYSKNENVPTPDLHVCRDLPLLVTKVGEKTEIFPWLMATREAHERASIAKEELEESHVLVAVRYSLPEEGEDVVEAKKRGEKDEERMGLVLQLQEVKGERKKLLLSAEELRQQFVVCNTDALLHEKAVQMAFLGRPGKAYQARDVFVLREKEGKMLYDKVPLAFAR